MEVLDQYDVTQEAILVRLYVRQAGISARSRTLTREAAEKHQADPRSVNGIVQKIEASTRAELTAAINQGRAILYNLTLPWDDNAYRLCPLKVYPRLKQEMQAVQNAFYDARDAMLANYEHMRTDYLRRVNDLAQEIPFPTLAEMERSFEFEVRDMPIARLEDVRLKYVDPSTLDDIKQRINQQTTDRLREAQEEIIERLIERVQRVKVQTEKEEGRIFESLIGNIEEDVALLPALNITNDPEITRLIERVKTELTQYSVEDLRKDDKLREHAAQTAGSVLKDLRKFKPAKGAPVAMAAVAPVQEVVVAEVPAETVTEAPVEEPVVVAEAPVVEAPAEAPKPKKLALPKAAPAAKAEPVKTAPKTNLAKGLSAATPRRELAKASDSLKSFGSKSL